MQNRLIFGLAMLAATPSLAPAQAPAVTNRIGAWEFSAGAGIMTIDRALNGNILVPMTISDPNPSRVALGVSARVGYNLSRYLGLSVGTMFSRGSGAKAQSPFVALTLTPAINASTQPFLMVGAGVTRFSTPGIHETSSFGAHFGMGVRQMISNRLALRLEGRMQSERFEEQRTPTTSTPAYNGFATLGLSYFTAGRAMRDADGDGVSDGNDRCANTPRGAVVNANGCPLDSDRDGVWDGLDRCPGTAMNVPVDVNGCVRDTDNDGVPDNLDRCAGTIAGARVDATGCPIVADADNDGVADTMDRCPGTPVSARPVDMNGCPPDSDRDGVADHLDRCPNSPAGSLVDEHGCPRDGDGDRVPDNMDRCPNTAAGSPVDASGCNIIILPANAADQMVLRVQFVTNRSELVATSTAILDSVAVAIVASPGSLWEVQGFTDSRGTVRANQLLSQQRAQAVVDYLVFRGVPRSTMTATGFASERAVGSNQTAEGQAANRRVQLRRRPAANPVQLP